MKVKTKRDYREARRLLYPDIGDQLDALWKIVQDIPAGRKAESMRDRIQQIKKDIPKNTQEK